MQARLGLGRYIRFSVAPLLAVGLSAAMAQQPQWQDQHHNDQQQYGNHSDQQQYGNRGDRQQYGNRPGADRSGGDRSNYGRSGNDFRFRDQDRNQFQQGYRNDLRRWHDHPQGRPHFERGQRIPNNYRFQPVPSSYYRGAPPPPGYQYGYYGGYVVAYNPTTRIIADVLDLAAASIR